ncbi:MAG: aminotransferase class I/II-fold pyridoxal phosphate-dependent enzyme [Chthoniobacterales bacterium]
MRNPVADHIRDIPKSGIRDFFEIVQSMDDVISLGIGEPDFVTPWHIREAAIYSLERGRTGYSSNLGLPRLRQSISKYVERSFGLQYDPKHEVLVSVGVSEAIDSALRAILNPGDEVLYHEPCYVSYNPSVALAFGKARAIPTRVEDEFVLRAEDLDAAVGPKSRVVMLNFPTNPTGATLTLKEAAALAEVCVRRDLIVLTDEIYSELTYDGGRCESLASFPGMRERTVLLNGMSKAYAMTGFRIGYACGPSVIIEAMMKIHQYAILCASITSQDAAIEALDRGAPAVARMRSEYGRRRNFIVTSLNAMGLECFRPRGAFYVFPNVRSTGLTSAEFSMRLLREKNVAVVPGTAFGGCGEGFVRASYATGMEDIKIAMKRMAEFVAGLNVSNAGK